MEKIEEKSSKKSKENRENKENLDETKVINNLGEIIKKNNNKKKETEHIVATNQILQNKPQNKPQNNSQSKTQNKPQSIQKNIEQIKSNTQNMSQEKTSQKQQKQLTVPKETKQPIQEKSNIIKEAEKVVNNAQETEYKKVKTKKSKKALIILLIIMFIILAAVIFSTIFSLINMNSTKIMNGVFVNGINISNLTKQQAVELLNNTINNNNQNYITVYRNGVTDIIHLEDIDGKFNSEKAVNEAYKIGRDGNIIQCNYDILLTSILKKQITSTIQYDKEMLEHKIEDTSLKMPDIALSSSYAISDNNVVIKNSKAGYKIKEDEFEKNMVEAFSSETKKIEIPVEKVAKQPIDIEEIYDEIYKEAKNAFYTTNPYKIYQEESGLDFGISIEEANKLLLEDKDEYIIPLKTIEPSIKVKDLDNGAFPNQLATFTTYYGTADTGRNYNIYLAAKSITETVVMPGETFSFNDLIGECSTRTGYRESTIYLNGELSTGIGGGICQVSTTLYNAVVRANLEIVQRRNHSLSVTYVPLGQDAMVSIGSSDFKFKNNRDYPIKVVSSTGTGSITCQIYGLKNATEYDVKLETKIISKTATQTKTQTYKVMYLNGKEVSRTLLSSDTYKNH